MHTHPPPSPSAGVTWRMFPPNPALLGQNCVHPAKHSTFIHQSWLTPYPRDFFLCAVCLHAWCGVNGAGCFSQVLFLVIASSVRQVVYLWQLHPSSTSGLSLSYTAATDCVLQERRSFARHICEITADAALMLTKGKSAIYLWTFDHF